MHTIWSDGSSASFKCNHEKTDTRLVYQALQAKLDVVNVVKGHRCPYSIDIGIQLVWYSFQWNHNSYADISLIVKHFGSNISKIFPTTHAISGCDTTSYFLQ